MGSARALACSVRRPAEHIHELTRLGAEIASEALIDSATPGCFTLSSGEREGVRVSVNSKIWLRFEMPGSGVQSSGIIHCGA
jgi:hypothetical protein